MYVLASLFGVVGAQGASSIAQGFITEDANIVPGALVSLKKGVSNVVELATLEKDDQLAGVVGEDALIELTDGESTIRVVTTGVTPTLVSNINGEVSVGDKIAASPIAGVGMKASESGVIVGTAQANLASVPTNSTTVTDKDGVPQNVQVGTIPVQVDVIFYTGLSQDSPYIPSFVQSVANDVAGQPVSSVRIISASLLIVLLLVSIAALLYSGVKSSIISIGRNPLSSSSIRRSLFQVGLTIIGLLGFTVILVYLILTF